MHLWLKGEASEALYTDKRQVHASVSGTSGSLHIGRRQCGDLDPVFVGDIGRRQCGDLDPVFVGEGAEEFPLSYAALRYKGFMM